MRYGGCLEFVADRLSQTLNYTQETGFSIIDEGKELILIAIKKIVVNTCKLAGIRNPNPNLKLINLHIFRHSIAHYLKNKDFSAEWN